MRTYLFLAVMLLIAVFALWLQEDIKQQPPAQDMGSEHFPDYFMDNFNINSLNSDGATSFTIQASHMKHYADDDSAELENPLLEFMDTGRQISIRAGRATYLQQENLVHLYDQVVITRKAGNSQDELTIETDYLKINTRSRVAETDQPAQVSSQELRLNARGLIYDNTRGRLKLTSQVKGIYETAP